MSGRYQRSRSTNSQDIKVCVSDGNAPPRRRSERRSVTEKRMLDSPVPASVRLPVIKKIAPRKTQPAGASTEPRSSLKVLQRTSSLRRSPRISPKTEKENTAEKSSKWDDVSNSESDVLPSSPLRSSASGSDCTVEPMQKKILSPVSDNVTNNSPSLDERDDMSKKVRRSYSRLDASFSCNRFGVLSSQGDNSDSSTPNHSNLQRRSFFGFEKLLATEVLANVSPVPPERPLLEQTSAETSVVITGSLPQQPDTDIPGIAFGKEKKKKKKIPQIDKLDLDEWAAQMNAEFDEAEKFDLLVE
ncbi:sororin [Rhinatrema bivittatum]|uniref:sororin n=1 Tax=Rhinatrema bivittatum TaxID=194408 RepID=UPI0011276DF6|nr:sororin [Rhinatrema bivittatum]